MVKPELSKSKREVKTFPLRKTILIYPVVGGAALGGLFYAFTGSQAPAAHSKALKDQALIAQNLKMKQDNQKTKANLLDSVSTDCAKIVGQFLTSGKYADASDIDAQSLVSETGLCPPTKITLVSDIRQADYKIAYFDGQVQAEQSDMVTQLETLSDPYYNRNINTASGIIDGLLVGTATAFGMEFINQMKMRKTQAVARQ